VLRLNAITLEDFGPFKGTQTVRFLPGSGVTVIGGNNGLGKTKLLNAIRYALFGHVVGRTDTPRDLGSVANWETRNEKGFPEFKVVLEFDNDGTSYRLTRHYVQRGGVPASDVVLAREGAPLTQAEGARELERILPEQIARFFLFDGELLRQYEELANDPSRGEDLKRAIERILGVPVLTNSRTDVQTITGRVTSALARAAAANRQTQQLGASLQAAESLRAQYKQNVQELEGKIEQLEHERAELEEAMSHSDRSQRLLARRDLRQQERTTEKQAVTSAKRALQEGSALLWLAVIAPRVNEVVTLVDRDIEVLEARVREAAVADATRRQREHALSSGTCPICGQTVPEDVRTHLLGEAGPAPEDSVARDLRRLQNRRDVLEPLRDLGPANSIAELESELEEHQVAVIDLDKEIEALDEQLVDVAEGDLRKLALDYSNAVTMLATARDLKEKADKALADQETAVRQLTEQLARLGGVTDPLLDRKALILGRLDGLFANAVTHYRELLRQSVEAEATRIFRLLRTQEEYDHLSINEGYGLTIIHRDGEPITDRSAGYEHLVAIALLGALQRCAPIRGPVIMDSPFGRLDPEHTARVVAALPEIAEQVILCVYEDEFDREAAAAALRSKLLAEHELIGITARHTEIRERGSQ
jgi:DNA sulfur modification protein DndD